MFLLLGLPFWEYRTDDTYIFLRYAQNWAAGLGPAFNPGEPTYGFSSPLWLAALTGAERLGIGGLTAAKVLAVACGVASVWGFWWWARAWLPASAAGWVTCAWAANGWLVRWSAAGMETALILAWTVWCLALDARAWQRREVSWGAAVCAGAAALTRPEGAILAAVLCVATVWRAGWRHALAQGVIVSLLVVPWLLYAQFTFGGFLPITGAAKGTVGVAWGIDPLRDVARAVAATSCLEVLLAGLGIGLALGADRRPPGWGTALGWLGGLILFYSLTGFDVLSRYALPIVPVVVVAGFWELERLPGRWAPGVLLALMTVWWAWVGAQAELSPRVWGIAAVATAAVVVGLHHRLWPRRLALAAALVVLGNAGLLANVVYPHTHAFSRGVIDCFQGLGTWFAEHTEPDAQVAIADIGAFGYYSNRRVVDMAGLITPQMIPLVDAYPIEDIARGLLFEGFARPAYLVDRADQPERLLNHPSGAFQPFDGSPCAIRGLGVRSPATIFYTAYRLDWPRFERWRGGH